MTKKTMKFTKDWMSVFKTFVQIGVRSPHGSYVLIKKNMMKVMHSSSTVLSTYEYDDIDIEKPIALFDANKLLTTIESYDAQGKEYTFEFINDHHLIIRSGRSSANLYLMEYKEVASRDEAGIEDENSDIQQFILLSDDEFNSKIDSYKEDKIAEFIITEDDMKEIERWQKIMKVSNKLFSITKGDNGIKFVIAQDDIKDNPDMGSFEITTGIDFNELTTNMEYAVRGSGKMRDIKMRNYKAILSKGGMLVLESMDDKLVYLIACEANVEEESDEVFEI